MLASDRREKILKLLSVKESIKTIELSEILNVTLETVRRDLTLLSKQGKLKKVHGGAIRVQISSTDNKQSYSNRAIVNTDEKRELAKLAMGYIEMGDTIALNSSTTNLEIAKLIKERNLTVTIITNSLLIASEVESCENISLILAGGIYYKKEFAFLGQITANFLSQFSINKAFLSVGGVSLESGISDYLLDEVIVEKKFIEISQRIVVVADSSKFETNSLFNIVPLENIDFIITDSKLDNNLKENYCKRGIKIIN